MKNQIESKTIFTNKKFVCDFSHVDPKTSFTKFVLCKQLSVQCELLSPLWTFSFGRVTSFISLALLSYCRGSAVKVIIKLKIKTQQRYIPREANHEMTTPDEYFVS